MKIGVRSQKSGVTPVSNAGSCPANRTHRHAPSPFLGGGEKVAAGRMRGEAANADARNPSPRPSPLLRGRERESSRVAVLCHPRPHFFTPKTSTSLLLSAAALAPVLAAIPAARPEM